MTPKQALEQAKQALKAGDTASAAGFYRAVLAKVPRHAAALKGLQRLEGRPLAAAVTGAEVQALIGLINQNRHAEAEQQVADLIRRSPDVSGLYNIRGIAQGAQDKNEAALVSFRKSVHLDGRNYEAWNNLGLKLKELGQLSSSQKALEKALAVHPGYVQARYNLATVQVELGDYQNAEAGFHQMLQAMPGFAPGWVEQGKLQAMRGRRAEAEVSLKQAIALDPKLALAYVALASVMRFDAADPLIGAMVKLVDAGQMPGLQKAALAFALGKAFEDAGAIDRSFKYYDLGNRLQAAQAEYSEDDQRADFAEIKTTYAKAGVGVSKKPARPRPIFIVGMNRSGTSLVEQILACHSEIDGCGELEDISRFGKQNRGKLATLKPKDMDRFRNAYLSVLKSHGTAANATDKMPANFKYIGLIRQVFPEAPIICLEREARDLCFSNYKASVNSLGHMYSYDQRSLARYYMMHRDLMNHWFNLFGDSLYRLSYEKLTQSPEAEIRAVLAYCGLGWEPGVMAFHESDRAVKTLSQSQVRNQINRGSVGAWRKYESHLAPMLEELAKGGAI